MVKSNDEQELELPTLEGFTDNDCCKIGSRECIVGKIVAIQLEPMRFEYSHCARQLVLVEGGAGASGERGRIFTESASPRENAESGGASRRWVCFGMTEYRAGRLICWPKSGVRGEIDDGSPSNDSGGAEIHV